MWVELLPIEDGTLCIRYFEEPYSKMSSFFPNKIIAIHLKEQNDTNSLSQVRTKDLRPHAGLHSQNGLILGPSYPTLKQNKHIIYMHQQFGPFCWVGLILYFVLAPNSLASRDRVSTISQ
jgi:hypothetical protein